MTAAQLPQSGMLLYACALALCFVCIADTLVMACSYKFYPGQNPPSAKLVFLAEAMKLLMASCFYLLESIPSLKEHKTVAACKLAEFKFDHQASVNRGFGLPVHRQLQHIHGWWPTPKAVKAGARAMLVFSVPAVCYFLVNK